MKTREFVRNKREPIEIPLNVLKDITSHLETVYGGQGKVVIIGGRAINLQCSNNARPTHDIDLIVPRNISRSDMANLPKEESYAEDYFYTSGEINSKTRTKLFYKSVSMVKPIEIDIYYPGWSTASSIAKSSKHIGGRIPLPLDAIVKESETVKIGGMEFTVPKVEVLMVMKYNTWLERDRNGKSESKDMNDMMNIIRNHGNGKTEFVILMDRVSSFMDRYAPDLKPRTVNGILIDVPFKKISNIDPRISSTADDLFDRTYLLRTGT